MIRKLNQASIGALAMLALAASRARAQVVIAGSSALFSGSGQASYSAQGCAWTTTSNSFAVLDQRLTPAVTDNVNAWITWQPSGACSTPVTASVVAYLNTDSTPGLRCFFASPRCTVTTTAAAGTPGSNLLPQVRDTALPAAVLAAISGAAISLAATDIRPEDAKFATMRALKPCGTPVVPGSQYLGLGYSNGTVIHGSTRQSNGGGGGVTVADFNLSGKDPFTGNALPGNFAVTPIGAAPVVVIVNPTDAVGFGDLEVVNISRPILTGFLDGTFGVVFDLLDKRYVGGGAGTTVYLDDPLSGAWNAIEYSIANNMQNQSSQDVGLAALNANNTTGNPFPPFYCSGGAAGGSWLVSQNPLNESFMRNSGVTSARYRAIGTANMIASVQSTSDSLGYAFWSAANFANAGPANTKYLPLDGVDPLRESWTDGLVPSINNGLLGDVTLAHVKDGAYPIWSILRLVSDPTGAGHTAAINLAGQIDRFQSPGYPGMDIVPLSQLAVAHSHFAPPGVSFPSQAGTNAPSNGTGSKPEAGGDVGGQVYTLQAEGSYNADNGVNTGNTGHRQ